jgi:hypothetical protein
MKNGSFNTLDVKNRCESKLGVEFRSGGEFNGWVVFNGKKVARITIPKGRKPIPRKTYSTMANQLKLEINEFDQLLECPLKGTGYFKLLETRII